MTPSRETKITGHCYCGAITFSAEVRPFTVSYCHCSSCRRATGCPVAAFAAFKEGEVSFVPDEGTPVELNPGIIRTFCPACGSSLTGRYGYLPGQVYVSIGVIDQADALAPELHSHESERLPWLHIEDEAERVSATATDALKATGQT